MAEVGTCAERLPVADPCGPVLLLPWLGTHSLISWSGRVKDAAVFWAYYLLLPLSQELKRNELLPFEIGAFLVLPEGTRDRSEELGELVFAAELA